MKDEMNDIFDEATINQICSQVTQTNYSSYYTLLDPCLSYAGYQKFTKKFNIAAMDMA